MTCSSALFGTAGSEPMNAPPSGLTPKGSGLETPPLEEPYKITAPNWPGAPVVAAFASNTNV